MELPLIFTKNTRRPNHGPLNPSYPLLSLIASDIYKDILKGLLISYNDTGFLPKWLSADERSLMPGPFVDVVVADASVKGIGHQLMLELLEAMLVIANKQSLT